MLLCVVLCVMCCSVLLCVVMCCSVCLCCAIGVVVSVRWVRFCYGPIHGPDPDPDPVPVSDYVYVCGVVLRLNHLSDYDYDSVKGFCV